MNKCRLCAGNTRYIWSHLVLNKYDVPYFECDSCGSLQTELPYWLDEAYLNTENNFDTGACQRSVDCALRMSAALEVLHFNPNAKCLDYGAGLGLYSRLMRDRGWSYFAHDRYSSPFYMNNFVSTLENRDWSLVSAFEVFEHFQYPAQDIEKIANSSKDYVFFSTELWCGQGRLWEYLIPAIGQHVFFYTRFALELVARRYGYVFHDLGFLKCFARIECSERIELLRSPNFEEKIVQSFLTHQKNPYRYASIDSSNLLTSAAEANQRRSGL